MGSLLARVTTKSSRVKPASPGSVTEGLVAVTAAWAGMAVTNWRAVTLKATAAARNLGRRARRGSAVMGRASGAASGADEPTSYKPSVLSTVRDTKTTERGQ